MSMREQVRFLLVLYTVPTVLFAVLIVLIEFGPGAAERAARAAEVAAARAAAAATDVVSLAATGAHSVTSGERRAVDTGSRVIVMTRGEFLIEHDRATRERVNNGRAFPSYLERDFTDYPEVDDAE